VLWDPLWWVSWPHETNPRKWNFCQEVVPCKTETSWWVGWKNLGSCNSSDLDVETLWRPKIANFPQSIHGHMQLWTSYWVYWPPLIWKHLFLKQLESCLKIMYYYCAVDRESLKMVWFFGVPKKYFFFITLRTPEKLYHCNITVQWREF
jgi:hypothetical protein